MGRRVAKQELKHRWLDKNFLSDDPVSASLRCLYFRSKMEPCPRCLAIKSENLTPYIAMGTSAGRLLG